MRSPRPLEKKKKKREEKALLRIFPPTFPKEKKTTLKKRRETKKRGKDAGRDGPSGGGTLRIKSPEKKKGGKELSLFRCLRIAEGEGGNRRELGKERKEEKPSIVSSEKVGERKKEREKPPT